MTRIFNQRMHDNHKHEMLTTVAGSKMPMMTGNKEGALRIEEAWTEKTIVASIDDDNDDDADDDWLSGGTEEEGRTENMMVHCCIVDDND